MRHLVRPLPIAALGLALAACGQKKSPAESSGTTAAEPATTGDEQAPEPEPAPDEGGKVIVADGASSGLVKFVRTTPVPGAVWVGPLEGNGGRDVLIYSPNPAPNPAPNPDTAPAAPIRLVYHFHGTYSETIAPESDGARKRDYVGWLRVQETIEAITQLAGERPYRPVLVYPLSAGKRLEPDAKKHQQNKHYDRMWMRSDPEAGFHDSFDRMHAEVVEHLSELELDPTKLSEKVLAEGHSAGGIALRNIARSGTRIVSDYLFLDASFQGWADGCHAALEKRDSDAEITLVVTERGIADPYGKRDPWCKQMPLDAQAWPEHQAWCKETDAGKARGDQTPPGAEKSCDELAEAAELWPKSETWCADYREDLAHTKGVRLVRTNVYHGDQPRHFAGGLELDPELGVGR